MAGCLVKRLVCELLGFWAWDRRKSRGACTFLSPQTLLFGDTRSPGKPFSQGQEPSKSCVVPGGVGRAGLRCMVCVCSMLAQALAQGAEAPPGDPVSQEGPCWLWKHPQQCSQNFSENIGHGCSSDWELGDGVAPVLPAPGLPGV